jgi:hypothetical protein
LSLIGLSRRILPLLGVVIHSPAPIALLTCELAGC